MSNNEGDQLAEILENNWLECNDVDDIWATSCASCNYENYEEFAEENQLEFLQNENLIDSLKELSSLTTELLKSSNENDICDIFTKSTVNPIKFNLFVFYKLENARKSDSSPEQVFEGVLTANSYLGMCALKGAKASKLFQEGLYEKCMKIMTNCCRTIKIGDTGLINKKSGGAKKKKSGKKGNETVVDQNNDGDDENEEQNKIAIGPPKISVESAEDYLKKLTTQLFGFLLKDKTILDEKCLKDTINLLEELGRIDIDIRCSTKSIRAKSIQEFRLLDKFVDRYSAFLHVLVESKYKSRQTQIYTKIVGPRLSLIPFSDETNKGSKVPTERKRAAELITSFVIERIKKPTNIAELNIIRKVLITIYYNCPDYQEFRATITSFIIRILTQMDYRYVFDFVQTMHLFSKKQSSATKQISVELAIELLEKFDFSIPDPGPIEEENEEDNDTSSESSESEISADEEMEVDDEDEERNEKKSKKKKYLNKKKKDTTPPPKMNRIDGRFILHSIIHMACINKVAPIRLHGSNCLAKILSSEKLRKEFQECCQSFNENLDEKYGEINENLNETVTSGNNTQLKINLNQKKSAKNDLFGEEQAIIQKLKRLEIMNNGKARIENDTILMLLRRFSADDKAPIRKSSCQSIQIYLSFCDNKEHFDTIITILSKMCRDRMTTVRKTASETITELMLNENIIFKELLSSKWLNSLIHMLDDAETEVQEHARRLIMKVISPLLDSPNELTWTLLKTIEANSQHKQYFMGTLKDAANEGLVKANVMEIMKKSIEDGKNDKIASWMVLSQLSAVFGKNVEYAVDAFHSIDLGSESKLLKYVIHVITNNLKKIDEDSKKDLKFIMIKSLKTFSIHPMHSKDIYYCAGLLLDGIGDQATGKNEFNKLGEELSALCFDTIVESFKMFRNKSEWEKNCESQERLLVAALNVTSEVFLFSPKLVPLNERLAKTLSLIVNSNDQKEYSTINPDVPSIHNTRPPTQMSDIPSSQRTGGIFQVEDGSGVLFSDKVRAVSVVTLGNMIISHDKMLKLMPMFVKQLQSNPSHEIRSNIVVAMGDICETYKTDRYSPILAACLCDPSVIVRRHAINQIARMIASSIFRFSGEVMIRLMLAILDANEDVRNDARLYISEVLQHDIPDFFSTSFVQYMIYLTQAKRVVHSGYEEEKGYVDVTIGGGDPLAKSSRIAIYNFMIESLDDRARFEVKKNICLKIINPIVNGEYDFSDINVHSLLDDSLLIMASNEMQVKMEVGKNTNDNGIEDPSPEIINAATDFMRTVYLQNYMDHIIPSILNLREFLNQHRSPLQRKCQLAIRMICLEHKNDLDTILKDNRQLKDEMIFELQRVKQRAEEANRILDEHLKKIAEHNRRMRRLSKIIQNEDVEMEKADDEINVEAGSSNTNNVEMISPTKTNENNDELMNVKTPNNLVVTSTPKTAPRRLMNSIGTTPQSSKNKPLSPKTVKKLRRSIGLLINQNEMRLKPPMLNETVSSEVGNETVADQNQIEAEKEKEKTISEAEEEEKEKTITEAEEEEQEKTITEAEEEEKEKTITEAEKEKENDKNRSRSRRRKTPTPEGNEESINENEQKWKKPKLNSPDKNADCSDANVTVRRSRRIRHSTNGKSTENESKKAKTDEASSLKEKEKENAVEEAKEEEQRKSFRAMTPLDFDTTVLHQGRHCSTPINGKNKENNALDMTFDLNISAIGQSETQQNPRKSKKKSVRITMAEILEAEE